MEMTDSSATTRRILLQSLPEYADVILDTDTDNEMDDQFALCWLLLAKERISVKAVTAAPFYNDRSNGPEDGMKKSLAEIRRWLAILHRDHSLAVAGSPGFLNDMQSPYASEATTCIINAAREAETKGHVLYIVAIAALTNVASALLLEPRLSKQCVLVWLGGNSRDYHKNDEFNLAEDIPATQIVLNSGIPLVRIPTINGAVSLTLTLAEMREHLLPCGIVGEKLYSLACHFMNEDTTRIIWDISAAAWFLARPAFTWRLVPTPDLDSKANWLDIPGHQECCEIVSIDRAKVFSAFYQQLAKAAMLQS